MSSQRNVPCTFSDCPRLFRTVQEMKRHKESEPEHEYCSRCDVDFADEMRFLVHKLRSEKHIACPVCGLDFRSAGGRDGHIRQAHRADQDIACHGCQDKFKSASGLMRHIEDNECSVISQSRLLEEQTKKLIIKKALKEGEGDPMPVVPGPTDFDDIDGGVKLNARERNNREAMINQPKPGKEDRTKSVEAMLALKHWPMLGDDLNAPGGDLMSFEEMDSPSRREKFSTGSDNKQGFLSLSNSGLPEAGQTLRFQNEAWDPTRFFNSYTGLYNCTCGMSFATMKEFERHYVMKSRTQRDLQCPGCRRYFKSATALIAHCESPSVRCDINQNDSYGEVIDELSGGMIQAIGYNEDGTVKYEAGKVDVPNNTTIGVDLEKGKW